MSERVDKAIFDKYSATHPVTLEYMLMKQRLAELESLDESMCDHQMRWQLMKDRITELEAQLKDEVLMHKITNTRLLNEHRSHNRTIVQKKALEVQVKGHGHDALLAEINKRHLKAVKAIADNRSIMNLYEAHFIYEALEVSDE
jgi:hypothetical protein